MNQQIIFLLHDLATVLIYLKEQKTRSKRQGQGEESLFTKYPLRRELHAKHNTLTREITLWRRCNVMLDGKIFLIPILHVWEVLVPVWAEGLTARGRGKSRGKQMRSSVSSPSSRHRLLGGYSAGRQYWSRAASSPLHDPLCNTLQNDLDLICHSS